MQTLGGFMLRPRLGFRYHRERIETADGDFVDLDISLAPGERAADAARGDRPVVLVLHGLEGGSRSRPAIQATIALADHGLRAAVLNFRSCSGEPNRTPRFYHAGETGDLVVALAWLRDHFAGAATGLLGYSLGGNVLLKFLGELAEDAQGSVAAAAAVSVPFDLAAGAALLGRGPRRLYGHHFLRSLRRKYLRKRWMLQEDRWHAVRRARTLREFDAAATAPLHGFRDVDHYYAESSSARWLHRVRVPTLLIHSLDDPFLPATAVPAAVAHGNPWLCARFTPRGGHMGFVAGAWPWAAVYWAEAEAARFLARHLGTEAPLGR